MRRLKQQTQTAPSQTYESELNVSGLMRGRSLMTSIGNLKTWTNCRLIWLLLAASWILTGCASSTGQFYARAGLIDPPTPVETACPPAELLMDGQCSTCFARTGTEAEKYAQCRISYAELAERQRILIEIMQGESSRSWKFWRRGKG